MYFQHLSVIKVGVERLVEKVFITSIVLNFTFQRPSSQEFPQKVGVYHIIPDTGIKTFSNLQVCISSAKATRCYFSNDATFWSLIEKTITNLFHVAACQRLVVEKDHCVIFGISFVTPFSYPTGIFRNFWTIASNVETAQSRNISEHPIT